MKGILPIAIQAKKEGYKGIVLPRQNALEAAIVGEINVYGVDNIIEVVEWLNEKRTLISTIYDIESEFSKKLTESSIDFRDVKGPINIKLSI